MKGSIKTVLLVVLVVVLVAGGVAWYMMRSRDTQTTYRTAQVVRGDLLATIGATGTVEPEEVVDVGAQVAGQIVKFGTDSNGKVVDYCSPVEKNMVLAEIDPALYEMDKKTAQAQLAQSEAQTALSNANVVKAKADAEQMKAKLTQAQADWERAKKLGPSEALAQTTYDAYKSAYDSGLANLDSAKAAIVQAEASIMQAKASKDQAQAQLDRAVRNLNYCTITSPVKGVIIARRVNIGQTVVSSLNAPSLFLIAKDLKRMQVWVQVNEADIGNVHPRQPVTFTVDNDNTIFHGEVIKIHLDAQMTQNVVTYTVEVLADNSEGKLLPYRTANVQFELDRRAGVLTVPNAALRYTPQPEQAAPEFRSMFTAAPKQSEGPQNHRASSQPASGSAASEPATRRTGLRRGMLWVQDGQFLRPLDVRVGMSDGTMTEVQGDDLKEGLQVVISEQRPDSAAAPSTGNPLTPQFPGRRGGGR